jgi:cytochrome c oxidase assembly factor CtaG
VAGLILWFPVQAPEGLVTRLRGVPATVYLIAVSVAPLPIAFFMTWSRYPIYETFELAPRVIAGISPQDDQELAAAVFQVLGGLVIWVQIISRLVSSPEARFNRSPRLVPTPDHTET